MKHTYKITGMTCQGCQTKVENALNGIDGITAMVTLETAEATITMDKHISTEKLQEALSAAGSYTIEMACHSMKTENQHPHGHTAHEHHNPAAHNHAVEVAKPDRYGDGDKYYCPMHCEGDKTYDKAGNCPVCGMNLLKQPSL